MRIYDTLSGEKREFAPSNGIVRMYVCGVTPYAPCHVGHAMSYVVFDVMRRYMEYRGHRVRHVQNFTDIDDKLIERAVREGTTVRDLADRNIQEYFQNMDALHILRAHVYPRATEEIPRILELVRGLVDRGYAYVVNGNVYFRVQRAAGYGKLSHRSLGGMMAGARVEVATHKEHPMDFTLWKGAGEGEPSWESPWGRGRPGWHVECSAMALGYLGQPVDIHGGGQDLIFPHHENEIAQSEAYTGKGPFVRFWVHNGLLRLGEEKMSKSVGNLVTVREALERYGADALRLFFLGSHYRSPLTHTEEGVVSAMRAMERLRHAATVEAGGTGEDVSAAHYNSYKERFLVAMDDDLNTPQALAALFDLSREINRGREEGRNVAGAQRALRELGNVLGLTFEEPAVSFPVAASPFIELLVEARAELRAARQFELADRIRERLGRLGVMLTDGPTGTEWKFTHPVPDP